MSFIDVHHHVIGKNNPNAAAFPKWNINIDEETLKKMDIEGAILSLPVAGTPEITRKMNDFLVQFVKHNPKKYGMLACLPMGFPDEALKEIEYAYEILKVDGFSIPSNINGVYIGDDRMDKILEELNKRSAVVLIHPTKPAEVNESLIVKDMSIYEFPFDTTRSVMDLVYRGKIKKYPNIKWIISHAGGDIPYMVYRFSTIAEENRAISLSKDEIIDSLRSLYYDLALSTTPAVLNTLKELVGPSHILFGTDSPLRYENGVIESIEELKNYKGFNEDEKNMIMSETAKKLFPRFK